MSKKGSDTSRGTEPAETDDLKLINGIGPAVERRLHGVGIYTYARLAALSPADIAASVTGLSGLTAERITKQDWIGQARRLAAGLMPTEAQKQIDVAAGRQRSATFTLELLLDEDNSVRRSHIMHSESGEEDAWDGWQDAQLVGFLVQRAGLSLPLSEPAAPTSAESESAPPVLSEIEPTASAVEETKSTPQVGAPPSAEQAEIGSPIVATVRPVGVLRLREMEVVAAGAQVSQNFLSQGQPFYVLLTLDLTAVTVSGDRQLSYRAFIYSKSLEGHRRQLVGEAGGIIKSTDKVTVSVEGKALPKGTNRLKAVVILHPVMTEPTPQTGLVASKESDLLLIF